jgi:hypothetical protein
MVVSLAPVASAVGFDASAGGAAVVEVVDVVPVVELVEDAPPELDELHPAIARARATPSQFLNFNIRTPFLMIEVRQAAGEAVTSRGAHQARPGRYRS